MKKTILFLLFSCCCLSFCKPKESQPASTVIEPSIKPIFQTSDVIWGFDFIDVNHIVFSQRGGSMKLLEVDSGKTTTIQNVPPVWASGQGGLLDIALHPQFKENRWIYFSYAHDNKAGQETRIARAKLIEDRLENLEIFFTSNSKSTNDSHFGSRIVFDHKGYIFFSVGDRGQNRYQAQVLSQSNGKIHRLTEDGKIPMNNPFYRTPNAIKSIWSYGHRNPQGLFYDTKTNTLWEQEHGPKGGDEINRIEKGKNYGWPVITYGREYSGPAIGPTHKEGMEQPVYYYVPSIAPSGLCIYQGYIFSGALILTHLNRLTLENQKTIKEDRFLQNLHERIRNVKEGPDGFLYVSTDSGKLLQLKFAHENQ